MFVEFEKWYRIGEVYRSAAETKKPPKLLVEVYEEYCQLRPKDNVEICFFMQSGRQSDTGFDSVAELQKALRGALRRITNVLLNKGKQRGHVIGGAATEVSTNKYELEFRTRELCIQHPKSLEGKE